MNSMESGISSGLLDILARKVVGQPGALKQIVPYVKMHQAGLASQGRPIGVFLLLGPTGTGKTKTVEVLAEVLHGSYQQYLRIDCGEFQHDHEVARLIGAPPGYVGHRETTPLLSKQRLLEATSPACDISLVLFDEIEKAAPSLTQLLLGVLDKAILKLGDNTNVNFEKSLIFLTSNLGAREMMRELNPSFGFGAGTLRDQTGAAGKLQDIALAAVRKNFSPEFVNRIDAVVTYQPLSSESLAEILEQQIGGLQSHVNARLGSRGFPIEVTERAKEFMIKRGTSIEYGARELKRVVYRFLTQPLATMVAERRIKSGSRVVVDVDAAGGNLALEAVSDATAVPSPGAKRKVLVVDDNVQLLKFLTTVLRAPNTEILIAETGEQALKLSRSNPIDLALVDYMLPDVDGIKLSGLLKAEVPSLQVIMMTGEQLSSDDEERFSRNGLPLIQKPFLVEDLLDMIRNRLPTAAAASRSAP
jgi:ATP-dependent Clp protease ATP-binding subunit ClpA/ActR/RegA family two-component response regulator